MAEKEEFSDDNKYDRGMGIYKETLNRWFKGRVVIKGKEIPVEKTRQGPLRYYLHETLINDTALTDWRIFAQEVHTHSGKHIHQGGVAIFVLDGEGYTVVDGHKVEWKKGDLILLPLKPGGVEHQHFNRHSDKPAKWLALSYRPYRREVGQFKEHKEDSPEYKPMR